MSQAVLYVNESGRASIDAAAIMESAIELVFSTIDPEDIDSATIPERIESAHVSLLGIAAKLLANGMTGTALAPSLRAVPAAAEAEPDVVVSAPVAPAAPVLARPSAQILELPLQRPVQPRKKAEAKRVETKPAPRAKAPAVSAPVQEALPLEIAAPAKAKTKTTVKAKAAPKRRRADKAKKVKFPGRLSRIEDAVKMDVVVCLEDGKRVTDLGKHLETLGMTPEEYRRKWKLSEHYPMMAPSAVLKRGAEYEYDPITRRMVKTR
ncbi:MucR family transcriptional regulator [Rhizobium sp. BK176]|uniref:MucR family transcriptional regulator n=1 Tax=Rhizobium sp. BK176 TaxID=2587071 RepID=UPI00216A4C55|nr:MucR family transcriptional regulator [Rhizobium sp. BK176]MCS4089525.1 putative transcriptional regulator [Rhizobium sp. BK176]